MLEILLLVLQIVTLILLFLFIWWVVRSARRDLVSSAEVSRAAGRQPVSRWGAGGGWAPVQPTARNGDDWPSATPTVRGGGDWPSATPTEQAGAHWPVAAPAVQAGGDGPTAAPTVQAGGDWPTAASPAAPATGEPTMAAERSPRLVVESSPLLAAGQEIPLEDSLEIGRTPNNDLVLGEAFVSSAHARIVRKGQSFVVEDLHSTNGTFVNERRVAEAQLKPDTRLRIGETVFRYEE